MHQSHKLLILTSIVIALAFGACSSRKPMVYLHDAERDSAAAIVQRYNTTVMPADELEIDIVSRSPESLYQFYQRANGKTGRDYNNEIAQEVRNQYTVSSEGTIVMPILGTVSVGGLPIDTVARHIEKTLRDSNYVEDPTVMVQRVNFRITVVGEVMKPNHYTIEGNRITILEALALAGDIKDHGQRYNVMVLRNNNGKQTLSEVDLTTKEMLNSPYYYLQQNDIVYVEPDDIRKRDAVVDVGVEKNIELAKSVITTITNLIRRINRLERYDL